MAQDSFCVLVNPNMRPFKKLITTDDIKCFILHLTSMVYHLDPAPMTSADGAPTPLPMEPVLLCTP
jgi:hypothetical protein